MTAYSGGQMVDKGLYLNRSGLKLEAVTDGGMLLPGNENVRYTRLSIRSAVMIGPVLGLLYAILLPIALLGSLAYLLFCRIRPGIATAARAMKIAG